MTQYLTAEEILYIHSRLLTVTGGVPGVRDDALVGSIPTRLRMSHKGQEFFDDAFAKASLLMAMIVQDRPFHDGNKRAGITASAIFLRLNGHDLLATDHEVVDFCRSVDRGSIDVMAMRSWFKAHTTLIGTHELSAAE